MIHPRFAVVPLLALAARFPVAAQSVVSTHSGVVYFFQGAVWIGGEQLEQKFGKFPDIGEGRELRTEHGRAEVLLTPGVFLRIDDNSAIRMISDRLSDTRVELLGGSAILEARESGKDTSVRLLYKNWQVRAPERGVCRLDADPAQIAVYEGKFAITKADGTDLFTVDEGKTFPLEKEPAADQSAPPRDDLLGDSFKDWAMSRSEAISADNTIASQIIEDPSQMAGSGLDLGSLGGFSYFPLTGIPSLGITDPYGLSFWSPYQSTLMSIYFPTYLYGPLYRGWPGSVSHYPRRITFPGFGSGLHPGGIGVPGYTFRPPISPAPIRTGPHAPAAPVGGHPGVHVGGHR
jgi:FecR-like protein